MDENNCNLDENKLTMNRLIMQHNYLEVYLQEVEMKYKKYNLQFLKEYYEQNPDEEPRKVQNNNQNTPNVIPDDLLSEEMSFNNQDDNEKSESSDFKTTLNKVYRKLSLKTHPDKNSGNDELFIKVNNAYNRNNLLALIKIAESINCDINIDYTIEIINNIEKDIKKLEDKIHELQHHVCWLWCHADEETKRKFKLPK